MSRGINPFHSDDVDASSLLPPLEEMFTLGKHGSICTLSFCVVL